MRPPCRPGRLRHLAPGGALSAPLQGVPKVAAQGQGGLLDVALSPDFARDRLVYLSYAEAGEDRSGTAVGRGRLSADLTRLDDFTVIFRQQPKLSRGQHYGARLVFDRQGFLFVALGENNDRPTAQDLDKLQGKVVRLHADGSVPADNPFVGHAGRARKSGRTAIAIRRAWRSIPGTASCGSTSMVRAAATKSTWWCAAPITADRWPRTASITRACRFRRPRGHAARRTGAAVLVAALAGHQRHGVLHLGPVSAMARFAVHRRIGQRRTDPAAARRRARSACWASARRASAMCARGPTAGSMC